MDLTNTFNDAAGPSGGASPAGSGPSPTGPHPSDTVAPAEAVETSHVASESHDPTNEVNDSVPLDPDEPDYEDGEAVPSGDAALAELELLERGRPKPTPRHNLNPPTALKKVADTAAERQREARIYALKAYVQSRELTTSHEADQTECEELEFGL